MGFSVTVAPRPELLLDDLTARLERPLPDPFDEDVVVVPTTGVRNWLRAELAVRLGILVRVRFVLPGALPAIVLGAGEADEAWGVDRLAWQVLGRVVADPVGAGLAPDEVPWGAAPERPWTVARRVAVLLDGYAAQRPGMLAAWARGEDRIGPEPDAATLPPDQRWQAAVWRRLVDVVPGPAPALRVAAVLGDRGGVGDGGGPGALAADALAPDLPPRLTVVGPGSVTDHALRLVARAAARTDVAVMAVRHRSGDAAPLAAWGRRARDVAEAVDLLAAEAGAGPLERSAPPGGTTQLARLRDALVGGTPAAAPPSVTPTAERRGDGSVVVHACHGIARQLEVARDAVLHALDADPGLRPHDVLVLCADLRAAAPLLGPVLAAPVAHVDGRERRLAVDVVDRAAWPESPVRVTLHRALAAAVDRLTREDVEGLLAAAPVRATLGIGTDDLEVLGGLLDQLHVRWGVDAAHRARWAPDGAGPAVDGAGDLPGDGTWVDARDRLAAGLLLHPDADRVVRAGDAPLAPARIADEGLLPLVGRMTEAVGALVALARAAGRPAPAATWARHTAHLVRTLLRPQGGGTHAEWRAEADRILDVVDELVAGAAAGGAEDVPIPVREWLRAVADRLGPPPGGTVPAVGRVRVGALEALRGVPARVVVLVGPDDATSGATPPDADDVLAASHRRGERDPAGEARATLLEVVAAAQERLVITCAGRSVTTGEEVPLPIVVEELCDALPDLPDGSEPLVVQHPRHLADPRALGVASAEGPPVRPPGGSGPWTFSAAALALLRGREAEDRPVLGVRGAFVAEGPGGPRIVDPLPAVERDGWVDLDLDEVHAALREPSRTYVRRRLELELPSAPSEPPRLLPLELDALALSALGRELLDAADVDADADAEVAEARWRADRPARGGLPPGRLEAALLDEVAAEVRVLRELAGATDAPEVHGAEVVVDGGAVPVRLAAVLRRDRDRTLVDLAYRKDRPRERLAAWLQLLVAARADPADPWLREVVVVRRAGRGLDGRDQKGPVRHVLRLRGEDDAARAANAAAALTVLVGLAVEVRAAPLPVLARTTWLLASGAAKTNVAKELDADVREAAAELLVGTPTADELRALRLEGGDGVGPSGAEIAERLHGALEASLVVATTVGGAA